MLRSVATNEWGYVSPGLVSESGVEGKGVDLRDSNAENWGDQQNKNFVYEFC